MKTAKVWITEFGVKCPHCKKESFFPAGHHEVLVRGLDGKFVENEPFKCEDCGKEIGLDFDGVVP